MAARASPVSKLRGVSVERAVAGGSPYRGLAAGSWRPCAPLSAAADVTARRGAGRALSSRGGGGAGQSLRRGPETVSIYQDAHERAHAEQIQRRFAGREVGNVQIALFGLTGGLIPCPASVTILLLCLHLKHFSLGATLVASFSLGLAMALVSVGLLAAWGVRKADARFGGVGEWARRAPYLSAGLMLVVGLAMAAQAVSGLVASAAKIRRFTGRVHDLASRSETRRKRAKSGIYSWYISILSSYSPSDASRSAADLEQVLRLCAGLAALPPAVARAAAQDRPARRTA